MEMYQYKDTSEVSKNYLLTKGYYDLYVIEDFQIDNKTIALLDISNFGLHLGKTLVIHRIYGVFIYAGSTKQLINEFYKVNQFGFIIPKALGKLIGISHYIPLIEMYYALMPITGGRRKNTDWISPSHIKEAKVLNGILYVTTIDDYKFHLNFLKGDFNERVHNVALLAKGEFLFQKAKFEVGMCEIKSPEEIGLMSKFEGCDCKKHVEMCKKTTDTQFMCTWIEKFIMLNVVVDVIGREEMIKFYCQNLARLKRNY